MQVKLRGSFEPSAVADIAISGLPGWATIVGGENASIDIRVWVPVGVEAYVRPPVPCSNPLVQDTEYVGDKQ